MSLRVVIADDHAPTRLGLRMAIEDDGGEVLGEAWDGPSAVDMALALLPDVVLMDVRMPGGGGIEAARALGTAMPSLPVVMLTVSRDDDDLFAALTAGAQGYLLKDIDPKRLPDALRAVLAGESLLPRNLVSKVLEEFRARERPTRGRNPAFAKLTEREWEVLQLLRDGRSTSEIATQLFVSAVTVRTHVAAIMRKLKVTDREGAIRLAQDS